MIQNLVDKNSQAIFKHPLLYLYILILLTGFFSYFYVTLPTETSLESLIFKSDPDLIFYENFKEQFGENELLVVGFTTTDVFTPKILSFIDEQTKKLERLENVDEVISLSNVENIVGSDNDFLVQQLVEKIPTTRQEQEQIRKYALESSLIGGSLVSLNSRATLFIIRPINRPENPVSDAELVEQVEQIFSKAQQQWPEFEPHYAGGIRTRLSLAQSTNRDMLTFMPLTYLLLIIFVSVTLRNRWLVFLAILNVSLCLIWTLAILNLIGGAMGPMTSILPPLIMALAVSDSIHIFTDFLRQDRQQKPLTVAIRSTLNILAVPCFLTSLTTAIGFLSLGISDIPPICYFGLASATGMIIEFALSMTVIPLGLYYLRNKASLKQAPTVQSGILHKHLKKFGLALPSYRKPLLVGSCILVILSIFAATQIVVETNLLEYFKKTSPTYKDARFVDQHLGGTETLEISIQTAELDTLLEPEVLISIQKIEEFLLKQPIVSNVASLNDFYREMNKAFHGNDQQWFILPDSRELAAQYLLLYDGKDIDNVLDPAHQWAHVSARINVHSSKKIKKLIEDLQSYIDTNIQGTYVEIRLTGQALIANKLIDYIISSQVKSLVLAFVLIFLVMFKIFKSFKIGLISLIPNTLPILFNFAIMGIFDIPLNSATAIIAAVAIGIAVDDTIHFIHAYQSQKQLNVHTEQAIQYVIIHKGVPIISTSLILAGGFGILLVSSFIPTIQFGLLVSLIMIFAILSDLLVLPCLFLKYDNE